MDEFSKAELLQISQIIQQLNDVRFKYEAEWGVGVLPMLVMPETLDKWKIQWDKFDAAVEAGDVSLVRELSAGCIRAWEALSREAEQLGHKKTADNYWEVEMPSNGEILRVYKTIAEARAPFEENVVVMSLYEVANMVSAGRKKAYFTLPEKEAPEIKYEFKENDEIGF